LVVGDYHWQIKTDGSLPDMWVFLYLKNPRSLIKAATGGGEASAVCYEISLVCLCVLIALVTHGVGYVVYQQLHKSQLHNSGRKLMGLGLREHTLIALAVYTAGAWLPAIHPILSICGCLVFSPPGSGYHVDDISRVSMAATDAPNVLYIVVESLSAAYALNNEYGRKAMPFVQSMLNNPHTYLFEHARSVSGDTVDCMGSLITGCAPYKVNGAKIASQRTIGSEFKAMGYHTASFSSCQINWKGTRWFMMDAYWKANMDVFHDPLTENLPVLNEKASDDRTMLPLVENWLKNETRKDHPFYSQMYLYNSHWPTICPNCTQDTLPGNPLGFPPLFDPFEKRYITSMTTVDETIKFIFESLNRTGHLDNTAVIISGDHGESPGISWKRLSNFEPEILQPITLMYVPEKIFTSPSARETLKSNQAKVVSTLDLFPTLQHILYRGDAALTAPERRERNATDTGKDHDVCISGLDLMSVQVPSDRLTISWNYLSQTPTNKLFALSNTTSALFIKEERGGRRKVFSFRYDKEVSNSRTGKAPTSKEEIAYWLDRLKQRETLAQHAFLASKTTKYFIAYLEKEIKKR
jgi:hypothetical protein